MTTAQLSTLINGRRNVTMALIDKALAPIDRQLHQAGLGGIHADYKDGAIHIGERTFKGTADALRWVVASNGATLTRENYRWYVR